MLDEEMLLLKEVQLLGKCQYWATKSKRNKILHHMRQTIMRIFTDTEGDPSTDEI